MNDSSRPRERFLVWWHVSPTGRTMGAIGMLLGLAGIWIAIWALRFAGWTLGLIVGLMAIGLQGPLFALPSWRFQRRGKHSVPEDENQARAP